MRTFHVYIELRGRIITQVVRADFVLDAMRIAANSGPPWLPGRAILWADEPADSCPNHFTNYAGAAQ